MSRLVKPYGDTQNDGKVQLSFTLPVQWSEAADEAARQLAGNMGFTDVQVVDGRPIATGFSFFVLYASTAQAVDVDAVGAPSARAHAMTMEEIDAFVGDRIGRKIRVAGACIGTDAHTVGIDAILNVKGFAGEKGLEYYRELKVVNLGAQVTVPELVSRARAEKADAVLVSQVVTQKEAHLQNTREFAAAFREQFGADRPLLVAGGPRFDPAAAAGLGVDRIFAKDTTPRDVASYLVHALVERGPRHPQKTERASA